MSVAYKAAARPFLGRIESVRGIAAAFVAFGHTMGLMVPDDRISSVFGLPWRGAFNRIWQGLIDGETAVLVFFVISGLVIGRSLDGKSDRSPVGYLTFVVRRLLRLYPAQIATLTVIVVAGEILLVGNSPVRFPGPVIEPYWTWYNDLLNGRYFADLTWRRLLGNYLMLGFTLNFVVWSIFVELCVVPLLPLLHRISRRDDWRIDAAVVGLLAGVAILGHGALWCEYWFAFYVGMLVQTRGRTCARFLIRTLGGAGPAAGASYLLLVTPGIIGVDRPTWVILSEGLASFLLISVVTWSGEAKAFSFLDGSSMRWNGKVSYSFYLCHFFVLTALARLVYASTAPHMRLSLEGPLFIAVLVLSVAIAWAMAYFCYRFVELPGIALGNRFECWVAAQRKKVTGPPTPATV